MHLLGQFALGVGAAVCVWHGLGGLFDPEGRGQLIGGLLMAVALACVAGVVMLA